MNYLICKTQHIVDDNGNDLGGRIIDKSNTEFQVSSDYEWMQSDIDCDIYVGQWYMLDGNPVEYISYPSDIEVTVV